VIFLTVGNHDPFDRLVRTVDLWCAHSGAEIFGQITERAGFRPQHFESVAHLPAEEYRHRCREADFIVAHAGMGSIITAMTFGKAIAVLPRRSHLGEQRNDHQYATVTRLGTRLGLRVALDEAELLPILDRLTAESAKEDVAAPLGSFAEPRLVDTLRDFIHQERQG